MQKIHLQNLLAICVVKIRNDILQIEKVSG